MTIKLITIDVDGTLLNSKNEITDRTVDVLKQAIDKGIKVVIASGRPTIGTKPFFNILGIDNREDQYAINYNGAVVAKTNGDVLASDTISMEDYLHIEKFAKEHDVKYQFETADYIMTPFAKIPKYAVLESTLTQMPIWSLPTEQLPKDTEIAKVMFIDEEDKIDEIDGKVPAEMHEKFNVVRSYPYFIEFINKTVSKGLALRLLAEKLGISIDETMAIGDQGNDLSMVEQAGIGVAMGNGVDQVKQAADFVTLTNDEDGVAHAVEKFALTD